MIGKSLAQVFAVVVESALCSLIYYSMLLFSLNWHSILKIWWIGSIWGTRGLQGRFCVLLSGNTWCFVSFAVVDINAWMYYFIRLIILYSSNSIISFFIYQVKYFYTDNFSHLLFCYFVVQFLKEQILKCLIFLFHSFKNN